METATVTRQTSEEIFKLVEPLDWSQLRALLWESHNLSSSPDEVDWQKLADFIAERSPNSPQHSAENYKTVFDNLAARYPEAHEIFSNRGVGQQLWTRILYNECYRAFAFEPVFMNLGFVELGPEFAPFALPPEEEPFRLFIQMYRHVLKQADLKNKDVLEIGCGAGGGATFIARNYQPKSVTGIDLMPVNITAAEARSAPGLTFAVGDATSLQFPDNSFDVVVNIESSHSYSSVEKFFSEVKRVLKPGGVFLFADHRPVKDEWGADRTLAALEKQVRDTGMAILNEEDITPNINAASDLLAEEKEYMLTMSGISGFEQTHFREILHCRGTRNYEKLKSGEWQSRCYALQKPAEV